MYSEVLSLCSQSSPFVQRSIHAWCLPCRGMVPLRSQHEAAVRDSTVPAQPHLTPVPPSIVDIWMCRCQNVRDSTLRCCCLCPASKISISSMSRACQISDPLFLVYFVGSLCSPLQSPFSLTVYNSADHREKLYIQDLHYYSTIVQPVPKKS